MSSNPALRKDPTEALLPPATFKNDDIQMDLELLGLITNSVGNNGSTITLHTNQIAALTAKDLVHDASINSLSEDLDAAEANITSLQGSVVSLDGAVTDINTELLGKQDLDEKDQPNGYAGLNVNGKVTTDKLILAPTTGGVWTGSLDDPSDRTMAVMVYDTLDQRLKPLSPSVITTYWHMGAVADALTDIYVNKPNNSVTDALDTRLTTAEGDITTINTTSLPAKQDTSEKDQANGYPGLNINGKIPMTSLIEAGEGVAGIYQMTSLGSTTSHAYTVLGDDGILRPDTASSISTPALIEAALAALEAKINLGIWRFFPSTSPAHAPNTTNTFTWSPGAGYSGAQLVGSGERFLIPASGDYRATYYLSRSIVTTTATSKIEVYNFTTSTVIAQWENQPITTVVTTVGGSTIFKGTAGHELSFRHVTGNGTVTTQNAGTGTYMLIEQLSS